MTSQERQGALTPGEILPRPEPVMLNAGRPTLILTVLNTGDRPVQVGSHYHFFEVNRALQFDRAAAFAFHLDIPAGTAVRFEPGEEKEVTLVSFGGQRRVLGLNALTDGEVTSDAVKQSALATAERRGFLTKSTPSLANDKDSGEPAS
ncbi:MAG: urease subunit beta [Candidatus Binatia bacterium]